jgi:transposase-like protein
MGEQRKRMTAKRKLEVYWETRQKDANVEEILRRYGLHLNDLRRTAARDRKRT